MSTVCPVPSQVEPNALEDLIADARMISLPRQHAVHCGQAEQPAAVVIPQASISLVEGYDVYGV